MSSVHLSKPTQSAIEPARVAKLFAHPLRVAGSGFLRREISNRMQERLDYLKISPKAVLDAGCGTGEDLLSLQQRYTQAQMIGVDISTAMLAETKASMATARSCLHRWISKLLRKNVPQLLQTDVGAVPLHDASIDLLWSNLALHWHPNPAQVFAEWYRLMRTEGALMFSCFGTDTFKELRDAFALIDDAPHTLAFVDMHDVGDRLVHAGFPSPIMDREIITVTYETPQDLFADVRAFGGNPLIQRRRGALSRAQGMQIKRALEKLRGADGKIPLTFEIVYGHAFKFSQKQAAQGEAVVQFVKRG